MDTVSLNYIEDALLVENIKYNLVVSVSSNPFYIKNVQGKQYMEDFEVQLKSIILCEHVIKKYTYF
jgi:hypothetical protein